VRYALILAYKGTAYRGWQSQLNGTSVQEVLETELSKLVGSKTNILGCGRTDAEVHATYFVAHFDINGQLPDRLLFRMNQMLPHDIALYDVFAVRDDFHARFSATYRKYIYKTTYVKMPFRYDEVLFLFKEPNIEWMNQACEIILNNTDFAAFCKSNADNKTTLCTMMQAEWVLQDGCLEFHVKANRFLRNMVRALVGTLLDIGYGNTSVNDLHNIIASGQRSASGKSVAAKGLYLVDVGYNWDEYRI
jgi:tRNA pseudouridine38-40 synthase